MAPAAYCKHKRDTGCHATSKADDVIISDNVKDIMKILSKFAASIGLVSAKYRGKAGMRAYAVGDVHGCIVQLEQMLNLIETDLKGYSGDAYLVFLGDLIDRGANSYAVVERLRTYVKNGVRNIFLMGNHEEFLLRAVAGEPGVISRWLEFGGTPCVASYGMDASQLLSMEAKAAAALLCRAIPASHIEFIKSFGDTFTFGDYLFVHAGIRPGLAIEHQEQADLRWIREPFLEHRGEYGFVVVHGHTVTDSVERYANRIGIDTGAYRGGPLTAAVVEGAECRFLSTGGQDDRALA